MVIEQVERLSAFAASADSGGNPAGVWIGDALPQPDQMQALAAQVGYSETAFAAPTQSSDGKPAWRVRYFAPQIEVPFCGHATIALGAALARREGNGAALARREGNGAALARREGNSNFPLVLNEAEIGVEGRVSDQGLWARLQSAPTSSRLLDPTQVRSALNLFGLSSDDLSAELAPAWSNAGAGHWVLFLKDRQTLAQMAYDFETGRGLMADNNLATIALAVQMQGAEFHVRNAFAVGGVVEDPATGAAAAALAETLRAQQGALAPGEFLIHQGDDMGVPSRLQVELTMETGSPIQVSGLVRVI